MAEEPKIFTTCINALMLRRTCIKMLSWLKMIYFRNSILIQMDITVRYRIADHLRNYPSGIYGNLYTTREYESELIIEHPLLATLELKMNKRAQRTLGRSTEKTSNYAKGSTYHSYQIMLKSGPRLK